MEFDLDALPCIKMRSKVQCGNLLKIGSFLISLETWEKQFRDWFSKGKHKKGTRLVIKTIHFTGTNESGIKESSLSWYQNYQLVRWEKRVGIRETELISDKKTQLYRYRNGGLEPKVLKFYRNKRELKKPNILNEPNVRKEPKVPEKPKELNIPKMPKEPN